jgi:exopolyphosphatase/guanosine-5'-triphosphate,3'-diphosphate pyrophosphatase
VLAGGFAIMQPALAELDVPRIDPVGGALRLGVLYDLLGRVRDATRASPRWSTSSSAIASTGRTPSAVSAMARALYEAAASDAAAAHRRAPRVGRLLHEVATPSRTPASTSTAPTSCRTRHAGLRGAGPAGGRDARARLRVRLGKMGALLDQEDFRTALLALRLAVLFHHARRPIGAPRAGAEVRSLASGSACRAVARRHPLTARTCCARSGRSGRSLGYAWKDGAG